MKNSQTYNEKFTNILQEETIMEKFSEMDASRKIQKWLDDTNTVVVSKKFTDDFIKTKDPSYSDYKTLVKWALKNNVVLVNKQFWDELQKNASFKV